MTSESLEIAPKRGARHYLKISVKIVFTLCVLAFIFANIETEELFAIFRSANLFLMPLILLAALPMLLFDSLRWVYVVRGLEKALPLPIAMRYNLVAWFFGNLAPGFIGFDGFRAFQMRRLGVPTPLALRAVAFDRLSAFITMLLVILLFSPVMMANTDNAAFRFLALATISAGIGGVVAILVIHRVRPLLDRLVDHEIWHKVTYQFERFVLMFRRPGVAFGIVASGLAVHLTRASTVFVIGVILSVDLTWVECAAFVPISLLIAMLPVSFGDWGIREAVFVFTLTNLGLSPEEALAVSISYGFYRVGIGVMGGFAWLTIKREHFAFDHA